jgi:hypothetical protein
VRARPKEAEDSLQEELIAIHTRRHAYDALQPFTPRLHAIARQVSGLSQAEEVCAQGPRTDGQQRYCGSRDRARFGSGPAPQFSLQAKHFFKRGVVAFKVHSRALALDLWSRANGDTWEYAYLLDDLESVDIPIEQFRRAAGYGPKMFVQHFQVLDEHRSQRVFNALAIGARRA